MDIKQQCKLAPYTTFGIGGPAQFCIEVSTIDALKEALQFAREKQLPYIFLGKGSNTLFDDRGFEGVVIICKIDHIRFDGTLVTAGAGASFSLLGAKTARKRLSGLEFASGIPGSVGGAIFMNAGANGCETKDVISSVTFLHSTGTLEVFTKNALSFSYRTSPFQSLEGCIVEATFALIPDDTAQHRQKDIVSYRVETQPYKERSAGCIFRNPTGHSAGKLIEECGLKGAQIGGASVSKKHANFILNSKEASASDIEALISHIRRVVKEKTGVELHDEVRRIPFTLSASYDNEI